MQKRYIKDITRIDYDLFNVEIWYKGEFQELEKAIGFGFKNTIFVSKEGSVTVYYEKEECDRFYEILDRILDEDFFNELCDDFVFMLESINPKTSEEIFNFLVKIWPAYVVFQEISNYPEYATEEMFRRLERIRKDTESFGYDLFKEILFERNFPDNYVFFQGRVYNIDFEQFIKEKKIIIENETRNI